MKTPFGEVVAMNSFHLRPHACGFFSSAETQDRMLTKFMREGVQHGHRVIYTVPPRSRSALAIRLGAAGVEVSHGGETECLLMQDWNVCYCPDGHFVPKRTLNFFENQMNEAFEEGYPQVRFATHMEWALEQREIADTLLEHEARANEVWMRMGNRKVNLQVLCVYDATRFDAEFLINVMRTHPFTVLDDAIIENPYYVPPAEFLKELRAQRAGAPAGGLAPWQLRRMNALFTAIRQNSPSVPRLAEECGLSPRHFSRAFTQSMGLPPHRWLLKQRIEMAKQFLLDPARPLADVALACGFTSQSHFTRIFSSQTGCSPGAWRRKYS